MREAVRVLRRRWRRSLSFRVVCSTMALGLVLTVALGGSLYHRIAEELVDARMDVIGAEALSRAQQVQASFDGVDRTDPSSLTTAAFDTVRREAASGVEGGPGVVFTAALDNDRVRIPPVESGAGVDVDQVPREMREALRRDPGHQYLRLTRIPGSDGGPDRVPAVAVASRIIVPAAGAHDLVFFYPLTGEQRTLEIVRQAFLLAGVALPLLMGLVAYVITNFVVTPVQHAARVAERLAAGDLDERMHVAGEDELARLAYTFNRMAGTLQAQISELEDLSHVQQRFVSDVSHELRTPLTTIRMAGEMLHAYRDDLGDPALVRSVELLYTEIDRFEGLLSDLLEISRYDAGATTLEAATVDLREVARRALDGAAVLAERQGVELVESLPESMCMVRADRRRIERVLRNLLVNAIEHGAGRPVELAMAQRDDVVAITVRDHGVGLTPEEARLVFARFYRADPSRVRTTGGTGLGLSISLADASLHGGWLQCAGAPGQGATFRLTLPREPGVVVQSSPLPLPGAQPTDAQCRARGENEAGAILGTLPVVRRPAVTELEEIP